MRGATTTSKGWRGSSASSCRSAGRRSTPSPTGRGSRCAPSTRSPAPSAAGPPSSSPATPSCAPWRRRRGGRGGASLHEKIHQSRRRRLVAELADQRHHLAAVEGGVVHHVGDRLPEGAGDRADLAVLPGEVGGELVLGQRGEEELEQGGGLGPAGGERFGIGELDAVGETLAGEARQPAPLRAAARGGGAHAGAPAGGGCAPASPAASRSSPRHRGSAPRGGPPEPCPGP